MLHNMKIQNYLQLTKQRHDHHFDSCFLTPAVFVALKWKALREKENDSFTWWLLLQKSVVLAPLSLISYLHQSTSQLQSSMVNNRNVWTPSHLWTIISPSSHLFSDLDINLSPSGNVIKSAGESLGLILQIDASQATKVSWTKVGDIML